MSYRERASNHSVIDENGNQHRVFLIEFVLSTNVQSISRSKSQKITFRVLPQDIGDHARIFFVTKNQLFKFSLAVEDLFRSPDSRYLDHRIGIEYTYLRAHCAPSRADNPIFS